LAGVQLLTAEDFAGEKARGDTTEVGGFFNVTVIVGTRVWFCKRCDENAEASDKQVAAGIWGAHVNAVAVRGRRAKSSVGIILIILCRRFLPLMCIR